MENSGKDADVILENFRREWKEELAAATHSKEKQDKSAPDWLGQVHSESETSNEKNASDMFLEGVQHEESGRLVEAIRFYKRAMQLVPDIEQRVYSNGRLKTKENKEDGHSTSKNKAAEVQGDKESEETGREETDQDLLTKFKNITNHEGRICSPREEQESVHISALPMELVVYLLKWVVSSDLDLGSLEQVAMVCRGFYVCSRDPELWRLVCTKVWGKDCNGPQRYGYHSWREMYIQRTRLLFNGCYISKTSYVRPGENSFQDVNYQPWHIVTYYRYIRFFPEGLALMLTTADEPNATVAHLRKRGNVGKHSTVLWGHYILRDEKVHVLFKRKPPLPVTSNSKYRRRKDNNNNNDRIITEQIFELDMEIKPHKSRLHWTLHWQDYRIRTIYINKEETVTTYDISPARFPPLWFSKVRSYTAESESPLGV